LLAVWRDTPPRWAALLGGAFGLAYFGVLLDWARYFGAVAIAPLVIAEAAFVAATGALVAAFAQRGFRSPWLVAAVWVVVEGLRARWPLGGLPWGQVGVALHDFAPARALASVGGVSLVSFAVVAANGLLLDGLIALRDRHRRALLRASAALLMLVVVGAVNDIARYQPTVTGHLRFALLQGNDQDRRLTDHEIESDYLTRRHFALAARLRGHYDLVVFPESALEDDPTQSHSLRAHLVAVGRKHGAVVLANALTETHDGGVANSNLAYTPGGRLEGVYSKQHLVPFGEYVPFRSELGFIGELGQVPVDYEAGHRRVLFHVAGKPIATVICFESAFAPLVRAYVRDGAQAIVVSTNNRSYRRSGLAAQHLALSQMRAAETARPVLHASISGISGVVDADGGVHDTSKLFVNKITTGTVATTTGETLYVRFGEWVLGLAALTLIGLAALSAVRERRRAAVNSRG
jgi:apolipoprotein N-acyltransferase